MDMIDDFFARLSEKNANGTLTVKEALIGFFYRLLEGRHAGRVIIKSRDKIDGKEIVRFANGFTWIEIEELATTRCENTTPTFSCPRHEVDRSEATWYGDNSDQPCHYEW